MKKITLFLMAAMISLAVNAQCTDYGQGPWTDFNTTHGGAPDPSTIGTENDTHVMDTFEMWKGEAYLMDNIVEGNTYIFSACEGPNAGAWAPDYAIGLFDGDAGLASIDAFGFDADNPCGLTFTATISGTYLIIINEVDNCGAVESIDNGWPQIQIVETLGVADNTIAGFSHIYSAQTKNLTISANDALSSINLFNIAGQQVISQKLSSNNETINLSTLKDGVYLANVTANGNTATFKIVKR